MNSPQTLDFDAELLQRYDRPGPRYTSYPTAPQFSADFGETALRRELRESNARARPLSLYFHIPFAFEGCARQQSGTIPIRWILAFGPEHDTGRDTIYP